MTCGLQSLIKLTIAGTGSKGGTVLSGSWAKKASKKPKEEHSDLMSTNAYEIGTANIQLRGGFSKIPLSRNKEICEYWEYYAHPSHSMQFDHEPDTLSHK